jgi:hypothetical protein
MADSAAYLSAVAALVGTFVSGITSIATSWLGQQRQTKEQRRARKMDELQALYKQFIQDASKLYVDALEHNTTEIPKLVDIYATLNRMRVLSPPKVVAEANKALRMIIDTYAQENTTYSGSGSRSARSSSIRCALSATGAMKNLRCIDYPHSSISTHATSSSRRIRKARDTAVAEIVRHQYACGPREGISGAAPNRLVRSDISIRAIWRSSARILRSWSRAD